MMYSDTAIQFHGFMHQILMGFGSCTLVILASLIIVIPLTALFEMYTAPSDNTGPR